MSVPALLGVPRPALGAALLAAWSFVLLLTLYRYDSGRIDRPKLLLTAGSSLLWIGFGLGQVAEAFSGRAATGIEVLFLVVSIAGAALLVQWWRTRTPDGTDEPDSA